MALFNVFRAENHLQIEIKLVGSGKELVAMGTKCFTGVDQCVFCRTISLPNFNGLLYKLAKIVLFNIYLM